MTWFKRAAEPCDALIVPPRQLYVGCDETLRDRCKARRDASQRIRERAARVDAGATIYEMFKRVK